MSLTAQNPPAPTPESRAADYFAQLHSQCEQVSKLSLANNNLVLIAGSHQFATELAAWCEVTDIRNEVELLRSAALEYDFGHLALIQGHYRHAFKSLRLVLELILQAVYLSANELQLREWLDNRLDTYWKDIVDKQDGVFSPRFAKGFFHALEPHTQHYGSMAVSLYRECSESVHGNTPKHIPLPSTLAFDQNAFDLWHTKANTLRLIAHFALTLRYFGDLTDASKAKLSPYLAQQFAGKPEIKAALNIP